MTVLAVAVQQLEVAEAVSCSLQQQVRDGATLFAACSADPYWSWILRQFVTYKPQMLTLMNATLLLVAWLEAYC